MVNEGRDDGRDDEPRHGRESDDLNAKMPGRNMVTGFTAVNLKTGIRIDDETGES